MSSPSSARHAAIVWLTSVIVGAANTTSGEPLDVAAMWKCSAMRSITYVLAELRDEVVADVSLSAR